MSKKYRELRKLEAAGAPPEAAFLNSWKPYLLLLAAGLLLYFRTFSFDYSYLDDNALILDKFDFISKASNFFSFFREDVFHTHLGGSYYRPVLTVTFMLDALRGGRDAGAYHVTNLLLHLAACCLLFRLLVKLNYSRAVSFFYALVFTVHPVLTQAVAWIPGRNDPLLAVFALLSFIFFLSYLETRSRPRLAAHLGLLLLALLTKENAVFLCLLCLFFAVYMVKGWRPAAGGLKTAARGAEPLVVRKFPLLAGWGIVVLGWFLARRSVLKAAVGNSDFDIVKSLIDNAPAVIPYLGKIFFPFNLGIMPVLEDLPMRYGVCAAALTAGLIYVSAAKRRSFVVFGLGWFLLFLLPSFIRSASMVPDFSEHRIYLPLIGFIVLLAELDIPGILKLTRLAERAAGAGIVVLFFWISLSYSGDFRNRISFWKKAVASSPSYAFSANNLGSMYYLDGKMDDAERMWKHALEVNPREKLAYGNLGLLYMNRGKYKEAEENYLKEIELNPVYDNVYFNLGLLYYGAGLVDKAQASWETALKINPGFAKVYANLALMNYQRKDLARARFYADEMLRRGIYVPPELLKALGK